MNLSPAQRARLGAFLVVGATLIVGVVLWLVGTALWAEVDTYSVHFRESVSGLEKASQVKYQGLRVGRVAGLRVDPKDPSAIIVSLAIEPGTVLYKGTEARLDQSALTGLTTINLSPGDVRAGKLAPGTVLPAGMSFTDQISGKAESIRIKIEALSNQLLRWSSDTNRKRVEHLIDETTVVVGELSTTVRLLRPAALRTLRSLERAGDGAVGLAHYSTRTLRLAREGARAGGARLQTTLDHVDRILAGLDPAQVSAVLSAAQGAMRRLEARLSAAEVDKTFSSFHTALSGIRAAIASVSRLLASVELSLRAVRADALQTIRHLRDASGDLRTFSRDIARDPALLLRGRSTSK